MTSIGLLSGLAPRSLEERTVDFPLTGAWGLGNHESSECSCGTQRWEVGKATLPAGRQPAGQGSAIVYNVLGYIRGWGELDSGY